MITEHQHPNGTAKGIAALLCLGYCFGIAVCPGPVNTPFLEHAYGRLSEMNGLKKLTMVKTECVVAKTIEDCRRHKTVSICGLPMKVLYLLTQSVQNVMQKLM